MTTTVIRFGYLRYVPLRVVTFRPLLVDVLSERGVTVIILVLKCQDIIYELMFNKPLQLYRIILFIHLLSLPFSQSLSLSLSIYIYTPLLLFRVLYSYSTPSPVPRVIGKCKAVNHHHAAPFNRTISGVRSFQLPGFIYGDQCFCFSYFLVVCVFTIDPPCICIGRILFHLFIILSLFVDKTENVSIYICNYNMKGQMLTWKYHKGLLLLLLLLLYSNSRLKNE